MGKKSAFEIICGTYEEFVVGFKCNKKGDEMTQTFAAHSHSSSVRTVAFCGDLLASGGADDRIVVYDLKSRKEHCMLTHHNGTINCMQFTHDRTHLMSGSQDGTIAIVRVGNWQLEKLWEGAHGNAAILDIAMHTSGKLALTLGADSTLKTWNLVKGRQSYVINLNSKCKDPRSLHSIRWCADSVRFALVGGKYSDIWSIETGGIVQPIEHSVKISSSAWITENTLVVGYENGELGVVSTDTGEIIKREAHNGRVKCLSSLPKRLISCSSDGEVKVWNLKLKLLGSYNSGCRFTSMCIAPAIETEEENDAEKIMDADESCVIDEGVEVEIVEPKMKRKSKMNEFVSAKKKKNKA